MQEKRTKAVLRITTPEDNACFISDAMGIDATKLEDKVEPKAGIVNMRMHEVSRWCLKSPLPDSSQLEEHLEFFVKLFASRKAHLLTIRHRIKKIDAFCMFSSISGQGSMELNSELLAHLAKHGIDVIIDLYPPE
jgi:hypothetical protein